MKKELEIKLFENYPEIFPEIIHAKNNSKKISILPFGFECSDGWYWLIDRMCNHIQAHIDWNQNLNIEQVIATQVKEKYGSLRFYYYGGDGFIEGIVKHTEWLSSSVCEECGSTENVGMSQFDKHVICYKCLTRDNWYTMWTNKDGIYYKLDESGNYILDEEMNE